MTLPHYVCETPMFMPVGTQGAGLPPPPAADADDRRLPTSYVPASAQASLVTPHDCNTPPVCWHNPSSHPWPADRPLPILRHPPTPPARPPAPQALLRA